MNVPIKRCLVLYNKKPITMYLFSLHFYLGERTTAVIEAAEELSYLSLTLLVFLLPRRATSSHVSACACSFNCEDLN